MNSKRKILIVDDDELTREMYVEVFRNAGFEVFEARDGMDGLDVAIREMPDVIFTGIIMPRMDGFSLAESLKKNVATANALVVISSHMGREEDRKRAEELGAKDFIVRDMTPPIKVVDRVNALFLRDMEYNVEFNPNAMDAQKLVRDFSFSSGFNCSECSETMVLALKIRDAAKLKFDARFVCPSCGWSMR